MGGIEITTLLRWLAMVAEARSMTLLEREPALEALAAALAEAAGGEGHVALVYGPASARLRWSIPSLGRAQVDSLDSLSTARSRPVLSR